jgi:hypothetical protein
MAAIWAMLRISVEFGSHKRYSPSYPIPGFPPL